MDVEFPKKTFKGSMFA